MIRMNSAFFHSLNQDSYDEARKTYLMLWTGAVPTDEEIKAVLDTVPRNGYNFATLLADFTAAGKVRQGFITYGTNFRPIRNNLGITSEFASRPEEFLVENEDAVGFFTLFTADSTDFNITNGTGVANIVVTGSVGDIGSGRDLEIPGGALSQDTTYKADDVVFNFV